MKNFGRAAALAAIALAAPLSAQTPPGVPTASVDEPRAFGYTVGDVVTRSIRLEVPAWLTLDETSLPQSGQRGKALELRALRLLGHGQQREVQLDYQVFVSPRELRVLDMPAFTLRFNGAPRVQTLRVDAWPVMVAPLAPVDAPTRQGLGELRPDTAPPLRDTAALRLRLGLWAGLLAAALATLAWVYVGLPWRARQRRPFGQAWRSLRRLPPVPTALQRRDAYVRLHQALNATAGQAMFEPGLDRWLAAQPRFAPLHNELRVFFQRSRSQFFAGPAAAESAGTHADRDWLIQFCRRCRDLERGTA